MNDIARKKSPPVAPRLGRSGVRATQRALKHGPIRGNLFYTMDHAFSAADVTVEARQRHDRCGSRLTPHLVTAHDAGILTVIPAEAGIQENLWTPAFAGVTDTGIWCQDFHVPL